MQLPGQHINDPEINNISEYLRLNAEICPDKPAILYPKKITYRELENKVNSCSSVLSREGIKPGTKTILMVPAETDFFVFIFSLFRIGAVPVLIDPGMGIRAMLSVITDLRADAFIGIPKAHLLVLLFPQAFKTVKIKITTGTVALNGAKRIKYTGNEDTRPFPFYAIHPHDMSAIFFTSGSTGPSKGVIYTSSMLKNQIGITKSQFKIGSQETDLCTFPLLGLFAVCHGNSSVVADMDMIHPAKTDPSRIVRNINDFGCTQMFGSPMVLNKLSDYCHKRNLKLHSLKNIISAGAPVQRHVLESFGRLLSDEAKIHTPYGATEALPVTDITASELLRLYSENSENENVICIGRPVEPLDVKIIEISDDPVESWDEVKPMPVNGVGEIVVRGEWVSKGYYGNNEADKFSKITDYKTMELWHRMGDLGKIDQDGIIWFYGRKSQRVITSEGTLFTIPCEAVYNRHPDVERSALVGIETDIPGIKRAVICIQLKKGFRATGRRAAELEELGKSESLTGNISYLLFKKKFPVDPRHNAKIFREKLAIWASKKIK